MFPVADLSPAELAFPVKVSGIMPKYEDIPKEFKDRNNPTKWNKLVSTWFFRGLKNCKWLPKEGVETKKALAHLSAVMSSFEPKHEHKEAAVAFLLSEWFEGARYEAAKS